MWVLDLEDISKVKFCGNAGHSLLFVANLFIEITYEQYVRLDVIVLFGEELVQELLEISSKSLSWIANVVPVSNQQALLLCASGELPLALDVFGYHLICRYYR